MLEKLNKKYEKAMFSTMKDIYIYIYNSIIKALPDECFPILLFNLLATNVYALTSTVFEGIFP
jgi:hypothetical protein